MGANLVRIINIWCNFMGNVAVNDEFISKFIYK